MTIDKIIKKSSKGDVAAQRKLYETYANVLYGICLRYMKAEDDAKDVLQDSFVKIFRNLDSYKFDGSFEGWIKKITVNTAITALNKQRVVEDIDDEITEAKIPRLEDNDNLELQDLLSLLNYLPEKKKLVFNLYEIEGFSHKEIATMLNITESVSRAELSKAKVRLQQLHTQLNSIHETVS